MKINLHPARVGDCRIVLNKQTNEYERVVDKIEFLAFIPNDIRELNQFRVLPFSYLAKITIRFTPVAQDLIEGALPKTALTEGSIIGCKRNFQSFSKVTEQHIINALFPIKNILHKYTFEFTPFQDNFDLYCKIAKPQSIVLDDALDFLVPPVLTRKKETDTINTTSRALPFHNFSNKKLNIFLLETEAEYTKLMCEIASSNRTLVKPGAGAGYTQASADVAPMGAGSASAPKPKTFFGQVKRKADDSNVGSSDTSQPSAKRAKTDGPIAAALPQTTDVETTKSTVVAKSA